MKQAIRHNLWVRLGVMLLLMLPPYLFSSGWHAELAYFEFLGQPLWMQLTLYSCIAIYLFSISRNAWLIWMLRLLETMTIAVILYMAWIQPSSLLAMSYALYALVWITILLADLLLSQNWSRTIMSCFSLVWIMAYTLAGIGLVIKVPVGLEWLIIDAKIAAVVSIVVVYLINGLFSQLGYWIECNRNGIVQHLTPVHHDQTSKWYTWLTRPVTSIYLFIRNIG